MNTQLLKEFSNEKISDALFHIGAIKAPYPDGFLHGSTGRIGSLRVAMCFMRLNASSTWGLCQKVLRTLQLF
jgi:hypothetical protein